MRSWLVRSKHTHHVSLCPTPRRRKENIEGRIKARQDRRKARRENKLLRAGFEGRKQGFITTPK